MIFSYHWASYIRCGPTLFLFHDHVKSKWGLKVQYPERNMIRIIAFPIVSWPGQPGVSPTLQLWLKC